MAKTESPRLNQEQRRYCVKRIDSILKTARENLGDKHTKTVTKKRTFAEKLRLIQWGDVCLKQERHLNKDTKLMDAYDFEDEGERSELDQKAFDREFNKVRKQANALKDKFVLGYDVDKAYKELTAFAAKYE